MRILQHSGIYFLARVAPGVMSVLSLSLFTRILDQTEYGLFVLVMAGADLLDAFLVQWLSWTLVRYAAKYEVKREVFYSTILAAFVVILVPAGFVTGGACLFWSDTLPIPLILIGYVYFVLNGWFELNLQRRRASLSPVRFGILDAMRAFLSVGFAVLFAWLGMGAYGVVLGYAIGRLAPTLVMRLHIWKGSLPWQYDRALLIKLFAFGLPLGVSVALGFMVNFSDRLLLGWLKGPEVAGMYGAGYDLAYRFLVAVTTVIHLAGYPLIVKALETGGLTAAKEQLEQHFALLLGMAGAGALFFTIMSHEMADLLLGAAFRESSAMVIPWVAIGFLLSTLRGFYYNYAFQLGERTLLQVWVGVVPAVLNIGLNLILIPRMEMLGAVVASVISFSVALVLSIIIGRWAFPMPFPVKDSLKMATALLAWAGVLLSTRGLGAHLGVLLEKEGGIGGKMTLAAGVGIRILMALIAASIVAVAINTLDIRNRIQHRIARGRS